MTFKEYQELARRTQNDRIMMHQKELHALHGLASEVGEIHAHYQKVYQGHVLKYDKIIDEIGDVLWFMAELADSMGVSMEEIAQHNIDKLRKRYPDGFDEEHSVHREEYT